MRSTERGTVRRPVKRAVRVQTVNLPSSPQTHPTHIITIVRAHTHTHTHKLPYPYEHAPAAVVMWVVRLTRPIGSNVDGGGRTTMATHPGWVAKTMMTMMKMKSAMRVMMVGATILMAMMVGDQRLKTRG
jgi:hypothetical protein